MELLSDDGSIDVTNQQPLDEVTSGLTLFEEGDVLFAKITPCMENGKGAFVRELPRRYAFGSTEFHVLRPGKKIDGLFLYYATFNPIYRAYAAENMVGAAGQKRVSSRFVKDTRLFLPPPPEQQRIAAYLDASCAAIDAAVAAKCRQLEILDALRKTTIHHAVTKGLNAAAARRASHVGWFGEIPKHWRCEHLKRFTTRIQTGMTPPTDTPDYYLDGTIPWFAPGSYDGDIELREPRKLINELARSEGKLRMFPAGTVFLVGIGATIGKVGLVPADASCNQQIIGIVCGHRMNSRFLAYQFKIYEDVIPGIATATTLPIFDQVKTGYLPTLQPPFEEQKSICAFLDIKLAESKQIVAAIESQIATLTAYRKSLIHECVTGQQRITEADVARVRRGESESMRPNR
jgi:type I restriction enzyme S subunit